MSYNITNSIEKKFENIHMLIYKDMTLAYSYREVYKTILTFDTKLWHILEQTKTLHFTQSAHLFIPPRKVNVSEGAIILELQLLTDWSSSHSYIRIYTHFTFHLASSSEYKRFFWVNDCHTKIEINLKDKFNQRKK